MRKQLWILLIPVLALSVMALLTGCARQSTTAQQTSPAASGEIAQAAPPESNRLEVFVPCAFNTAFPDIEKAFLKVHPNVEFVPKVENVEVLVQRLKDGKKPDLFMSVGDIEMHALQNAGLLQDSEAFCFISLGLVTKAGNPHHLKSVNDLATDKVKTFAIGTPDTSVGYYAEKVLKAYGLWDKVQNKLVKKAFPVALLQLAKAGKVDASIAYGACINKAQQGKEGLSQGHSELGDGLQLIQMFDHNSESCQSIECPAAIIKGARNPKLAREFLDFLQVDPAQTILKKEGLLRLDETKCY